MVDLACFEVPEELAAVLLDLGGDRPWRSHDGSRTAGRRQPKIQIDEGAWTDNHITLGTSDAQGPQIEVIDQAIAHPENPVILPESKLGRYVRQRAKEAINRVARLEKGVEFAVEIASVVEGQGDLEGAIARSASASLDLAGATGQAIQSLLGCGIADAHI